MITEDSFFYLPNLSTFQNGNSFYGSFRGMRFYVQCVDTPPEDAHIEENCGEEDAERLLFCRVWYGEYCMEESEIVASACFPMNQTGYERVLQWLDGQYQRFIL